MATKKKSDSDPTGAAAMAEAARIATETSSDGRFSEHHVEIPAADGHGAVSVEERGEPDKSVSPSDEE